MKAEVGADLEGVRASEVSLSAADGYCLKGHHWAGVDLVAPSAVAVIACATGVLARYYHRYARFLAANGIPALTFDYRGIGLSRHGGMHRLATREARPMGWHHWGTLDVDAALGWMRRRHPQQRLLMIGHSIGGFLPGLAPAGCHVERLLTVGAQFAYWRDYARHARLRLWFKWHLLMPALTLLLGYFPGRRLGWLEDLPAGVALEWARRGPDLAVDYRSRKALLRAGDLPSVLASLAAFRADILAIGIDDDEFGTFEALERALACYPNSHRRHLRIAPADVNESAIGHFGFFRDRFRDSLWMESLAWLREGRVTREPVAQHPPLHTAVGTTSPHPRESRT